MICGRLVLDKKLPCGEIVAGSIYFITKKQMHVDTRDTFHKTWDKTCSESELHQVIIMFAIGHTKETQDDMQTRKLA